MAIDADTVRALLRTQVAEYKNIKHAAGKLGVSRNHLGRILRGDSAPGLVLLKRLGLRRVIAYEIVTMAEK